MAWKKSSPELVAKFHSALPGDPRAERRQMFGYPASFVNGNMFTGLHEESFIVRLGEAHRTELLGRGGKVFEPMPGRPMKEYVVVPPGMIDDFPELRQWTQRAFEYVSSLPPKKKKPAAKKKAGPKKKKR